MMTLPDLDGLIAEVDRACPAVHPGDTAQEQPDWPELLKTAARIAGQLQALAGDLIEEYVEHCRMHGSSWSQIGEVLGITRQAAQQRFLAPPRAYDAGELSAELRQAMSAMKRVAVAHRNNYIGTEHVLWGILASDNSATRLLAARGAAADDLRSRLESRLTLGASRAAERIAWTPYARRVIALAKEQAGPAVIGCDHVLAGLVQLGRGVAADLLRAAGVDAAAVRPGPAAQPLAPRPAGTPAAPRLAGPPAAPRLAGPPAAPRPAGGSQEGPR